MTRQEAINMLERGCPHNPWTEDVCGNCAKDALEALATQDDSTTYSKPCRICSKTEHTTKEHQDWANWIKGEDLLD